MKNVIASATIQCVIATTTGQRVIATVSSDHIVQAIAGARDICRTRQRQVLDIRPKRTGHRTAHLIGAATCRLGYNIAGTVNNIDIIAQAARHRINAAATIKRISAGTAIQLIRPITAAETVIARTAVHRVSPGNASGSNNRVIAVTTIN